MVEESRALRSKKRSKPATGRQKKSGTLEMDAVAIDSEENIPTDAQPALPEDIQNRIGEQLRALYNQIVEEPVPGHLKSLLNRLQTKE